MAMFLYWLYLEDGVGVGEDKGVATRVLSMTDIQSPEVGEGFDYRSRKKTF